MAMEQLRAKKAFKYAGRPLQEGELFSAPPSHARTLTVTGNAETYIAPVVQAKKPGSRPRKNPATQTPNQSAGAYQRRDMTSAASSDKE